MTDFLGIFDGITELHVATAELHNLMLVEWKSNQWWCLGSTHQNPAIAAFLGAERVELYSKYKPIQLGCERIRKGTEGGRSTRYLTNPNSAKPGIHFTVLN